MLELKRIDEIASGLTLEAGTEFLTGSDREPITRFNESVQQNAAGIKLELERLNCTLDQAIGLSYPKIQKMRDERQSNLLTLLQQRVQLAEQRRALIQGFEGAPQAAADAATVAFDKAWQAAEKALRKAGISDAHESIFKANVRQTEPVREAQLRVDASNAAVREYAALRSRPDTAGDHAALDLIELVRRQLSWDALTTQ